MSKSKLILFISIFFVAISALAFVAGILILSPQASQPIKDSLPIGWSFSDSVDLKGIAAKAGDRWIYNFELCKDQFNSEGPVCKYFKSYETYITSNPEKTDTVLISIAEAKDQKSGQDYVANYKSMNGADQIYACTGGILKTKDKDTYILVSTQNGDPLYSNQILLSLKDKMNMEEIYNCGIGRGEREK